MIRNGDDTEEYLFVDVIKDYSYNHLGRNHRIYRNERYMVLQQKTNWWQVLYEDGKVLWAPCEYLRTVKLTTQDKKDGLRARYKKSPRLPHPTECAQKNESPASPLITTANQQPPLLRREDSKKKNETTHLTKEDISKPTVNPCHVPHIPVDDITKKQLKITKDDISGPILISHNNNNLNNINNYSNPQQQQPQHASSFNPQSVARLHTSSHGNSSKATAATATQPQPLSSSTCHRSSRLSLYDGSGCSSDSLSDILEDNGNTRRKGVKSKSFDGLITEPVLKRESYKQSYEKASSDEQLDNKRRTTMDPRFLVNQLSHRNRSNSVDFKTLSKEKLANEGRTEFNDKVNRCYGSKDKNLWRRSLVLEESPGLRPLKPFLRGSDDLDVSLLLDGPPKLPPKQSKIRAACIDSNKNNINYQTDIRVTEVHKQENNVRRLSREFEPNIYQGQNTLDKNIFSSSITKMSTVENANEASKCDNLNSNNNVTDVSSDGSLGSNSEHRVPVAMPRKLYPPPPMANTMERSHTCIDGFGKNTENSEFDSSLESKGKENRKDEMKSSFKEKSGGSTRKGSIRGFFSKSSSSNEPKHDDKCEESLPNPLTDGAKNKKLPKYPPSPETLRLQPTHELSDGWCVYWHPDFWCRYYYNHNTKEKRWKPPRKLAHHAIDDTKEPLVPSRQSEFRAGMAGYGSSRSTSSKASSSSHLMAQSVQGIPPYNGGNGSQRSHTPLSMSSSVSSFLGQQPASIESISSSGSSSFGHSYHLDPHSNAANVPSNFASLPTQYGVNAADCHISTASYKGSSQHHRNNSRTCDITYNNAKKISSDASNNSLASIDNTARSRQPLAAARSPSPLSLSSNSNTTGSTNDSHLVTTTSYRPTNPATTSTMQSLEGPASSFIRKNSAIRKSSSGNTPPTLRQVLPPRPPNSAKPSPEGTSSAPSTPDVLEGTSTYLYLSNEHYEDEEQQQLSAALHVALKQYQHPDGWLPKKSMSKQLYESMHTGEKWIATTTQDGKIYFYNQSTKESQWQLPAQPKPVLHQSVSLDDSDGEETLASPGSCDAIDPTASSPPASGSPCSPSHLEPLKAAEIVRQGPLMRTFSSKDGKKQRKNWTTMHIHYHVMHNASFPSGSRSLLVFTKGADDKINYYKCEMFDLYPPCELELDTDHIKSRQSNVIVLRNGHNSELLLRSSEKSVIDEWIADFAKDISITVRKEDALDPGERENKKGRKSSDRWRRDVSVDNLSVEQKSIRTKLMGFIKRRPTADALVKKGIYQDAVFGNRIKELCSQEKTTIPLFVLRCINAIERTEDNLKADGLYRISGNAAQIQKIRFEVAKSNYQVLLEEKDVNNLTGALKLFFRELKEPLLSFNAYDTFTKWSHATRREDRHCELLLRAVEELPKENFHTLKVLLEHLIRVCEYSVDNRMNFMNLAIVFGPCLLWPETSTGRDLMTAAMVHNSVVEALLTHFDTCVAPRKG